MTKLEIKEHNRLWYKKTYDALIEKGRQRGNKKSELDYYTESHHIIPKCMGGTDEENNLVLLTYKEHVIAHRLLTKIYPEQQKLFAAVSFLLNIKKEESNVKVSLKELNDIREKSIEYLRKINTGSGNPMYGKKISEEHKKILSEVNKRKRTEETKRKMALSQLGKKANEETRRKLSHSHKGLKIHSEERKSFLSERWKNNNPNAKKVIDSNGNIFNTLSDCSKFYNKSSQTIRKWIRNNPEKGFKFI